MKCYVDAHCHVSTSVARTRSEGAGSREELGAANIERCVMSGNPFDWQVLQNVQDVEVAFGVHPWYSHLFSLGTETVDKRQHYESVLDMNPLSEFEELLGILPEPIPLEEYIVQRFEPLNVDAIGEIGLDKLFRLPKCGFYMEDAAAEAKSLTRIKVQMSHQVAVFKRMCQLANKYNKPVSVHIVKAHQSAYETLLSETLQNNNVRICLHSYTGSIDMLQQFWFRKFSQERIFLSLSNWINFANVEKGRDLTRQLPTSCVLTETDFPLDTRDKSEIEFDLSCTYKEIASVWEVDQDSVEKRIYANYKRFVKG